MPVITGDATKYNCTKPYVPSVQENGHRETEQTKIRRRRTRRLIKNYTVCLQEIIFEKESKYNKTPGSPFMTSGDIQLIRMVYS